MHVRQVHREVERVARAGERARRDAGRDVLRADAAVQQHLVAERLHDVELHAQRGRGAVRGGGEVLGADAEHHRAAGRGGEGTRDGHWRESVFRTELMTGWIGSGTNPMSTMTIASLRDLGYAVNMAAADAYTLPARTGPNARVEGGTGIRMSDELIAPRFVVDERGRITRLR